MSYKDITSGPESTTSGVSPPDQAPRTVKLTRRQREVVRLLAKGMTNKEIAGQLGITEHTVEAHLRIIYRKLDVPNRGTAIRYAIENDLN